MTSKSNPLLDYQGLPKFDQIKAEHVLPAVTMMLERANTELSRIEANQDVSWATIIEPLDKLNLEVHKTWSPVNHLVHVKTTPEFRQAHEKMQPEVVNFSLRYSQSQKLFDAYKKIRQGKDWAALTDGQKRVIDANIRDAELSGIGLSEEKRQRYNDIAKELSKLSTEFSNNVLDSTKEFFYIVKDKKQTLGFPSSLLQMTAQSYNGTKKADEPAATSENGPWRLTLDLPTYQAFIKNAEDRSLRETIYKAYISIASTGKFDNSEKIRQILRLRQEQAKLLGFQTYAEVSLARKMAGKIDSVDRLADELLQAAWEPAKKELEEISAFAAKQGFQGNLEYWDFVFWAERFSEHKYQFKEEDVKAYFTLNKVLDGLFQLVHKIFNVRVEAADGEAPIWHPDVRFFNIFGEKDEKIASFYLDPYSRPENKRSGAWMDDCFGRQKIGQDLQLPVAYLICNSAPPIGQKPAVLTFREVTTLFHEFGHGLQHMLTKVEVPQVAGINGVEWDAVELPSQFMENWCYDKPTLRSLSQHVETGKEIPDDLMEKLKAAKNYLAATHMLRQLKFGMVDMELHHRYNPDSNVSVNDVWTKVSKKTSIMPPQPMDRMLCAFGHIFAGGYAAGYYSYKWAEVLSADAFSAFEEADLSNSAAVAKTGQRFRDTILALGGSLHPAEVFQMFRGRAPSTEALLRHSGLR